MMLSILSMEDGSAGTGYAGQRLSEAEEQELIRRCTAGDWSEFGQLVKRYKRLVWSAVDAAVADKESIPDLVQETFIRVYEKLHTYRFNAAFSSWLYRIARNIGLNHTRTMTRRPGSVSLYRDRAESEQVLIRSDVDNPAGSYGSDARARALENMLARLDEKYRVAVNMYYASGMTYAQIGKVLNLPVNTVRTRLKRGRERLMEMALKEGWQ